MAAIMLYNYKLENVWLPYGYCAIFLWVIHSNFTATEDPEDELRLNLNSGNLIISTFGTFLRLATLNLVDTRGGWCTQTVITVEFGTIHHHSSLEGNYEACLCMFLDRYKKITEYYVNCDHLVKNNHVSDSNMNTISIISAFCTLLQKLMISSPSDGTFEYFFLYL